jgi:hypothetical protein
MNLCPPCGGPGMRLFGGSARALPQQSAAAVSAAIKIVRPLMAIVLSCRLRVAQKKSAET